MLRVGRPHVNTYAEYAEFTHLEVIQVVRCYLPRTDYTKVADVREAGSQYSHSHHVNGSHWEASEEGAARGSIG